MGTPVVRSLYIFSEGGKMQVFRFFIKPPQAVIYNISVSHQLREGRAFLRVVTINSSIRGVLLRNSEKYNLVGRMPVPAHIKVEGDKNSISCIWYKGTRNERFCHPLTI